jgi:hypothetical protein
MGVLERIKEIEEEMARTQKNKATEGVRHEGASMKRAQSLSSISEIFLFLTCYLAFHRSVLVLNHSALGLT